MTIAKASKEDSKTLESIFSILYRPKPKWSNNTITRNMDREDYKYFILTENEEPLGAISLRFEGYDCELEAIAVDEKNQGKGYGSELVRFTEGLAKGRGFHKVWCYSLEIYEAEGFYEKHGWKKEGFVPEVIDGHGCFKFSKRLV
jgi:GNAT superfamily N-acetyltransferase